tara:strand:+ start:41 stop:259 length:219 start_codon:yes stop_codon:yes gene_type:complete
MQLNIKVIPNAKENSIEKENSTLKVRVTAPAVDNKANKAIIPLLVKYLKTKKSNIKIIKGEKSRNKLIQVLQ